MSDPKKSATFAISLGSPILLSDILETMSFIILFGVFFDIISVFARPGAITLTLILFTPSSLESTFACEFKAAFEATYALLPSLPSVAALEDI